MTPWPVHGPVPTEFTAATRNAYDESESSPVTVIDVAVEAVCVTVVQETSPTLRYSIV